MHPNKLPQMLIRFAEPFAKPHIAILCHPPFADINPIFAVVAGFRLRPYLMAIEQDAICEETAVRIYATTYAEGVIVGCDEAPFDEYKARDWEEWLLKHPDHLEEMRSHLDVRSNWPTLPQEALGGIEGLQHTG